MSAGTHRLRLALVGWPLDHSLSPAVHEAALRAVGIDGTYALLPTAPGALFPVLDAVRRGELDGVNVTIPHKLTALAAMDVVPRLVVGIGAMNTVVRGAAPADADRSAVLVQSTPAAGAGAGAFLWGHNTDVTGFADAMAKVGRATGRGSHDLASGAASGPDATAPDADRGTSSKTRTAVVLGAGGGARAALHVLAGAGYVVRLLARHSVPANDAARALARSHPAAEVALYALTADSVARAVEGADLLVNATPVGAEPQGGCLWPVGAKWPREVALVDMVAWPTETELVGIARAAGAAATGGLPMLVGQAAESFRLWTGLAPPVEAMREAAERAARIVSAHRSR